MDHIVAAIFGVVLLLAGIACFPIGLAFGQTDFLVLPFFVLGVLLLSAALPLPVWILDRLDGRD